MSGPERLPRLCFVAPMTGFNEGWVSNPSELLADMFRREGYQTRLTSPIINRWLRLADTVRSMLAWSRQVDLFIIGVYSGKGFAMADLSSLLAKMLGKKQIFVLHGGDLPKTIRKYPGWVRRVMSRPDAIVSPSGYLAHHFHQFGGYDVRIIPNMVRVEDYPYRKRDAIQPRLIWMRTFEDIYNPIMAVKVLQEVRKECPDATLVMAGQEKGMGAATQRYAREQGLNGAVHFPGFLDFKGKVDAFNRSEIYLNTNQVDNTPVSVIEAGAFGLPIVATSVGGIPFLLEHEKTALLVPDNDHLAMSQSVLRLLRDPDLTARLSQGGRQLAETTAWARVKQQWEQLFSDLAPW